MDVIDRLLEIPEVSDNASEVIKAAKFSCQKALLGG